MRFPIDTKKVADIPELEGLHRFPDSMAKFCLLFFEREFRDNPALQSHDKLVERISEESGFRVPDAPSPDDEPSPEFAMFGEALAAAASMQDNKRYTAMVALEFTLEMMTGIIFSTPPGDSLKTVEVLSKCGQGVADTLERLDKLRDDMAARDARLAKALETGSAGRLMRLGPTRNR